MTNDEIPDDEEPERNSIRHSSFVIATRHSSLIFLVMALAVPAWGQDDSIARAVRYLAREVPRWSRENHCYSCHNNGDAARALYTAAQLGHPGLAPALADTTAWLEQPQRWRKNGGDQRVSDQRLATVQFAFALWTAVGTGQRGSRAALREAARIVADQQAADGSWPIDAAGTVGSPATYGALLATVAARRVLVAAGPQHFQTAIQRAEQWLGGRRPRNVFDAAATMLALRDMGRTLTDPVVQQSLALVRRGEAKQGGWGPYVNAPPEPFDTAIVLLAIDAWREREQANNQELEKLIERGRDYLIESQLDEGGWRETTRPAEGTSYAQHLSTSGWVTLALLESRVGSQESRVQSPEPASEPRAWSAIQRPAG